MEVERGVRGFKEDSSDSDRILLVGLLLEFLDSNSSAAERTLEFCRKPVVPAVKTARVATRSGSEVRLSSSADWALSGLRRRLQATFVISRLIRDVTARRG